MVGFRGNGPYGDICIDDLKVTQVCGEFWRRQVKKAKTYEINLLRCLIDLSCSCKFRTVFYRKRYRKRQTAPWLKRKRLVLKPFTVANSEIK